MGDTESNNSGPDPNRNVKRARILVLLIPIVAILIAGGIALANSNIFQSFQSQSQVGGVTTEAALARDIEREADVLDVIELVIKDGALYIWIIDIKAGEQWSSRDSDAVTRALDVLFEYAKTQTLGVEITFFAITSLMGSDGLPADVLQGAVVFRCSAEDVASYGSGGDSNNVMKLCDLIPDGLYVSPNTEIPFLGR